MNKSITLKNILIDEKTGEEYFDLTAPSFIYRGSSGSLKPFYVTSEFVGNPKKISNTFFGTDEYYDSICIINNIFNPWSIKEGDWIYIPLGNKEGNFYSKPPTYNKSEGPMRTFTDTSRMSVKDKSRIERLIGIANTKKTGVKTPLPSFALQPGQKNKIFKDGEISFGNYLNTRKT